MDLIFKDAQEIFEHHIKTGALSEDKSSPMFAGDWMYMCSTAEGYDEFKNTITRKVIHLKGED